VETSKTWFGHITAFLVNFSNHKILLAMSGHTTVDLLAISGNTTVDLLAISGHTTVG